MSCRIILNIADGNICLHICDTVSTGFAGHWYLWFCSKVFSLACRELTTNSENPPYHQEMRVPMMKRKMVKRRSWGVVRGGLLGSFGLLETQRNGRFQVVRKKETPLNQTATVVVELGWKPSSSSLFCSDWCSVNLILVEKNCTLHKARCVFLKMLRTNRTANIQMASIKRRLFLPATTFSAEVTVHVYDVSRNEKVEIARETWRFCRRPEKKSWKRKSVTPQFPPPPPRNCWPS